MCGMVREGHEIQRAHSLNAVMADPVVKDERRRQAARPDCTISGLVKEQSLQ